MGGPLIELERADVDAHPLLDGVIDNDTTPAAPLAGAMIFGHLVAGVVTWTLMPIVIPGTVDFVNYLGVAQGDTEESWKQLFDNVNPAATGVADPGVAVIAARRDHVHPGGGGATPSLARIMLLMGG